MYMGIQAQSPSIEWQKCIGGSDDDYATSIIQTSDGGYITVGNAKSSDFDFEGNPYLSSIWVVKLSNDGEIEWKKLLGGGFMSKIIQNTKGNYIISATTLTYAWIAEIDNMGNLIWQKSYGGSNLNDLNSIIQTPEGGYLFVGQTASMDGDLENINIPPYKMGWIVKIDSIGTIEWQKMVGGTIYEKLNNVTLTSDNGYIIAGMATSNGGDVQGNNWFECAWILKLNSNTIIEWQKCIGSDTYNQAKDIKQCSDGGYIVACDKNHDYADNRDGFIVKLSATGTIEWQTEVGGNSDDFLTSIIETSDGGIIVGGTTESWSGDVPLPSYGFQDCWIVKLSNSGNIQWQRRFGGNDFDYLRSIEQTNDNGFIFAGGAKSRSNDVIGLHSTGLYTFYTDMWIVKLSPNVYAKQFNVEDNINIYPNPATNILNIEVNANLLNEPLNICTIHGQIVYSEIIDSELFQIKVNQLSKGIYFIKIGTSQQIHKFIVN